MQLPHAAQAPYGSCSSDYIARTAQAIAHAVQADSSGRSDYSLPSSSYSSGQLKLWLVQLKAVALCSSGETEGEATRETQR